MKTKSKARRAARQLFRLCLLDGALDDNRVRHVAQLVGGSKRRGAVAILSAFRRFVRTERDRHVALVESATPLSHDLRDGVEAGLARIYGARLNTSFEQNPGLIGGMRIRVGSDVYDGSVRARLAAIEAHM
jgi:F-type H+-transporting ATPase subunit delta